MKLVVDPSARDVGFGIAAYTVCSSVMLVSNKVAISYFPSPAVVFSIQLSLAVVFVQVSHMFGLIKCDGFTKVRVCAFLPYIFAFVSSVYCNGKALQRCNVETVIVFRACSPLLVSLLDWGFLGRELPSRRSLFALCGVVLGAVGYVHADSDFRVNGIEAYSWVTLYLVLIVFEMTYGKRLSSSVQFDTPVWGSVLYTNALGFPPMATLAVLNGEVGRVEQWDVTDAGVFVLAVSALVGIGISWAGWNCRAQVSATTFTLVGVTCKFLSVLLNIAIWDKHATRVGIFWLVVCLLAGAAYKQAPMRDIADAKISPTGSEGKCLAPPAMVIGGTVGHEAEDAEPGGENDQNAD